MTNPVARTRRLRPWLHGGAAGLPSPRSDSLLLTQIPTVPTGPAATGLLALGISQSMLKATAQVAGPPGDSGTSSSPSGPGDQRTQLSLATSTPVHVGLSGSTVRWSLQEAVIYSVRKGPGIERYVIT